MIFAISYACITEAIKVSIAIVVLEPLKGLTASSNLLSIGFDFIYSESLNSPISAATFTSADNLEKYELRLIPLTPFFNESENSWQLSPSALIEPIPVI